MRWLLTLALALFAASPAAAQSGDIIDFPPGAKASQDGFVAAIVTTNDFNRFGAAWGAGNPQTALTRIATRGTELKTIVLLQGCRPAADGKCNVTARFTYLRPDGVAYGTIDDDDLWTNGPRDGIVVTIGPNLVVDPPDPMGEWTLRAEIRDNVRGVTVTVRTPVIAETPPTAAAN